MARSRPSSDAEALTGLVLVLLVLAGFLLGGALYLLLGFLRELLVIPLGRRGARRAWLFWSATGLCGGALLGALAIAQNAQDVAAELAVGSAAVWVLVLTMLVVTTGGNQRVGAGHLLAPWQARHPRP